MAAVGWVFLGTTPAALATPAAIFYRRAVAYTQQARERPALPAVDHVAAAATGLAAASRSR